MSLLDKLKISSPFKKRKKKIYMTFSKRLRFMQKVKNLKRSVRQEVLDRETKPLMNLQNK